MHWAGKMCEVLPVGHMFLLINSHVLVLSSPDVPMINAILGVICRAISMGEHVHSESSIVAVCGILSVGSGTVCLRRHVDSGSSRMVV